LRRLINNGCRALFLVALVVVVKGGWSTVADEGSRGLAAAVFAKAGHDIENDPAGFKVERYDRLWERNPFTLPSEAAPQAKASAFDSLFLTCWLNDGGKEVIFVQNSQTSEVQRITAEPNQNNLRLLGMHLNSNPQFVEAALAAGKEQGKVRFRFDVQGASEGTVAAQMRESGPTGLVPNQAAMAQQPLPQLSANSSNTAPQSLPKNAAVNQVVRHPLYPGIARVHTEGGPAPAPRRQ
jgi:hypothetical protein